MANQTKQVKAKKTSNSKKVNTQKAVSKKVPVKKAIVKKPSVKKNTNPVIVKNSKWKSLLVVLFTVLACLTLFLGNTLFWTGKTLINDQRFTSTFGPLIEKPAVQSAVASYTTNQIFNHYNVEAYIQQSLPPRAAFIAPALTTQVKNYTQITIKTLLGNARVQKIWINSLNGTHKTIFNVVRNYKGNGNIKVSNIYSALVQQLKTTKLSFLSKVNLPSNVGNITVTTVGWLPILHRVVVHASLYRTLIYILFILFTIIAIALSNKKVKTVIKLCLFYAFTMLVTLLIIRLGREVVSDQVNTAYQQAVNTIYDSVLSSLVSQTIYIFLISLFIAIIAFFVDRYKLISSLKTKITSK